MPLDSGATALRLDGLEPDNLLAFLALLGLLRSIEQQEPGLRPRVRWTLDEPVVRPVLVLGKALDETALATIADRGITALASLHDFEGHADLKLSSLEARKYLSSRQTDNRSAIATALMSDAALKPRSDEVEPTPLCTLFGQGHQHFLERLRSVPLLPGAPVGTGKKATAPPGTDALVEALFHPWRREDRTPSFRWDPKEDVRYAYRATDPSAPKTKEGTQHGANRLAAVAIASLPCVPMVTANGPARAMCRGVTRPRGGPRVRWPAWNGTASLSAILALLDLPDGAPQVTGCRWYESRRYSSGKFMNWSVAEPLDRSSSVRGNS